MKNRIFKIILIPVFLYFCVCEMVSSGSETIEIIKNGSFEQGITEPFYWYFYSPYSLYETGKIDTVHAFDGDQSLKIERKYPTTQPACFCQDLTEFGDIKNVTLSAYLKTYRVKTNCAYISVHAYGENFTYLCGSSTKTNSQSKGSTIWLKQSVKMNTPDETKKIRVFLNHYGDGTAWFDKVSLKAELK